MFAANVVSLLQMMLLAAIFLNERLFPEGMRENKMAAAFGLFMVTNMVAAALTKSNAFEIYVGRKLIFSQLQNHGPPTREDLIRGFRLVGVDLQI
mmetsp:Transcript_27048/g.58900  ORF Transcript_27048/g.58900 Transcript_27048/m.58900 type:complete len:95 (+) Transcript_27048:537-821(+)